MKLPSWWLVADVAPAGAVLPVELFFDLVFVFTLTQLSHTLHEHLSIETLVRVVLLFGVLWWMYGGYAWLTNHVSPRHTSQRLLLFVGMAGFFLAAVAVPHAFDSAGLLFGAGYLIVVLVHLLLFTQSSMRAGVARLAPFNILSALLVLAAGLLRGPMVYVLWSAALLIMIVTPYLSRPAGPAIAESFRLAPAHFVERHGLLVIIALGESVIAIGMGVSGEQDAAGAAGIIALALALPAALWWSYFADTHAAEHALDRAEDATRGQLAIRAYFFAHIPLMLGIVIAAAGTRALLHDPTHA
ncbi:MAG: low temperature requirement protein A, partial [Gemmatimonadaceae bacterium]